MATFSAIALDRLLEPGASSVAEKKENPPRPPRLERRNSSPFSIDDSKFSTNKHDIPPPYPRLRRHNSVASAAMVEKKPPPRPKISPALYATPEPTPLPDSPTSFSSSSPYIINHKRRGPRLLKTFSERDVAAFAEVKREENDGGKGSKVVVGHSRSLSDEDVPLERKDQFEEERVNGHYVPNSKVDVDGKNDDVLVNDGKIDSLKVNLVQQDAKTEVVNGLTPDKDNEDADDFYEPPESMGFNSVSDGEDSGGFRSAKMNTHGEFYDAPDDLSSDSERHSHRTPAKLETELREMRLSLLLEIENRKQAEESLNSIRTQWQVLREKFEAVGLILPSMEDFQSNVDPSEDICRQIHVTRFVSESIGRGIAKAEAEEEMEAELEIKKFEIARLCDRLHYYETMNREMSHRNQEAVEVARRDRQKRKRRHKWVWGSIAAAITIGSAALAWSYLPSGRGGSSSINSLESPEIERETQ